MEPLPPPILPQPDVHPDRFEQESEPATSSRTQAQLLDQILGALELNAGIGMMILGALLQPGPGALFWLVGVITCVAGASRARGVVAVLIITAIAFVGLVWFTVNLLQLAS